ncbi:hypothetical protein ACT7C0_29460 [Bacillus cereus]
MHKSNEKTNANVIVCFFVTIITIIIVWFVFPAIQSAMTEYEIEEETVKKRKVSTGEGY